MGDEETRRMRTYALMAGAAAVVFLVLAIVFIILFATKSTTCATCPTCTKSQANPYYIVGVDPNYNYLTVQKSNTSAIADEIKQIRNQLQAATYVLYSDPVIQDYAPYDDGKNGVFVYAMVLLENSTDSQSLMNSLQHTSRTKRHVIPNNFTITQASVSLSHICTSFATPYYNGTTVSTPPTTTPAPGVTTTQSATTSTMQSTTTQCGTNPPSQDDYGFPCHPYLIYRDIVILLDVIPSDIVGATKTSQLRSFLSQFTQNLLPNQTNPVRDITRLALASYDGTGLRTTNMRFSSNQSDWQMQINSVMTDAENSNIALSQYAALHDALNRFQLQLNFRPHTDSMILIITDHISINENSQTDDGDGAIDAATSLKGDGFWIAAIIPTSTGAIHQQMSKIVTNPNDMSVKPNGYSYCSNWGSLTSGCVDFAKTEACQYLYPSTMRTLKTTPYTGSTTTYIPRTTTSTTIAPTTQGTFSGPLCQKLDILFVLDESESILETHFRQITDFVATVAGLYTFCGDVDSSTTECTQMAAIKFGDIARPITNSFKDASTRQNFINAVNNTFYDQGITNTTDALLMAEQYFTNTSYGARPGVNRVLVLITDGHHSEGTTDPKSQADKLRIQDLVRIISIGVNGTNGGYSPTDTAELDKISGNDDYVFPSISVDSLDIKFAEKVVELFPCPPTPCKGVTFLVETSEVVSMERIVQSLNDVITISDALYKADNQTQFGLITFSSMKYTQEQVYMGEYRNYSDWRNFVLDFANGLPNSNSTYYPFFQGYSYLINALSFTYQRIWEAKVRNINFQGTLVIFAQTFQNDYSPGDDINVVSSQLHSIVPKMYGVNKLENSNLTVWDIILKADAVPIYEDYDNLTNVATGLVPSIVSYMTNLTCQVPDPITCQQYLDIVFVIHRSSDQQRLNQIGEFVKNLAASYHLETDYVHAGLVFYDTTSSVYPADGVFRSVSQVEFNKAIDDFVSDGPGNYGNNIEAPLPFVTGLIGYSNGFSLSGNRKFAADVIMYITDEIDHIFPEQVMSASNYIYNTTDLNMPHVVVVAINANVSYAHGVFHRIKNVDMDLGVFAIDSYDLLNTSIINGGTYQINVINSYVCALLPQSLPLQCVPTQVSTTPPPPVAKCYAMDIIFVVDMSQSPNGEKLNRRRRYMELVRQLGSEASAQTALFSDPQFRDDFENEKAMLIDIINTFPNGHYGPPVGVQFAEVSFYNALTDITFYLNNASTQDGYDDLVERMKPYTGDTEIQVGLEAVQTYILNPQRGYRPDVPTMLMLFSDGNDNKNVSNPIPVAQQLIAKGVNIFALYDDASDSSPDITLLEHITGDNSRVVPLAQYSQLRQPFYNIIDNFINTHGYNPCYPPVFADIVFVMDNSENQVRAGENNSNSTIDYVINQKKQIKSIINQMGVQQGGGGHRFVVVHFSDSNTYTDPVNKLTDNKTDILFDTGVSFSESYMDTLIDNFPELLAGGATDLKLVFDLIESRVVPQIASKDDTGRITYMVIFTTGFYDQVTNCCQDPAGSATTLRASFRSNKIIPVMSGKKSDRNPGALLQYTGYDSHLPLYDVDDPNTSSNIVNTIMADIAKQEAMNQGS